MKMPDWEISLNEAEQARLRPVGYWRSAEQPELPDPATHVDAAWDEAERRATLSYLQGAPVCRRFLGYSTCRLCGRTGAELGDAGRTDGRWVWPSGLPHYLEHHAVRPPEEFLSDLRDAGFRLRGPIVPAETTVGRLDPNLLRGMVRSEEEDLVRLRLQRTATPRDLYLGVEVDRALGCYRLEVNDAALAAARLRNERMLHPPLWRRALRAVLPLLGSLLFALPFTWLVRRCSAVPGRQGTAAAPRAVGAKKAGVQRLLPAGKYRAIHFTMMVPASVGTLQARFSRSVAGNPAWLQRFVAEHGALRPGEPLPYHPNFGISASEYDTLQRAWKHPTPVDQESFDVEVKEKFGTLSFASASPILNSVTFSAQSVESRGLTADLSRSEDVRAAFGTWTGYAWHTGSVAMEKRQMDTFEGAVGAIKDSGRLFIHVSRKVAHAGQWSVNDEAIFWLLPGTAR